MTKLEPLSIKYAQPSSALGKEPSALPSLQSTKNQFGSQYQQLQQRRQSSIIYQRMVGQIRQRRVDGSMNEDLEGDGAMVPKVKGNSVQLLAAGAQQQVKSTLLQRNARDEQVQEDGAGRQSRNADEAAEEPKPISYSNIKDGDQKRNRNALSMKSVESAHSLHSRKAIEVKVHKMPAIPDGGAQTSKPQASRPKSRRSQRSSSSEHQTESRNLQTKTKVMRKNAQISLLLGGNDRKQAAQADLNQIEEHSPHRLPSIKYSESPTRPAEATKPKQKQHYPSQYIFTLKMKGILQDLRSKAQTQKVQEEIMKAREDEMQDAIRHDVGHFEQSQAERAAVVASSFVDIDWNYDKRFLAKKPICAKPGSLKYSVDTASGVKAPLLRQDRSQALLLSQVQLDGSIDASRLLEETAQKDGENAPNPLVTPPQQRRALKLKRSALELTGAKQRAHADHLEEDVLPKVDRVPRNRQKRSLISFQSDAPSSKKRHASISSTLLRSIDPVGHRYGGLDNSGAKLYSDEQLFASKSRPHDRQTTDQLPQINPYSREYSQLNTQSVYQSMSGLRQPTLNTHFAEFGPEAAQNGRSRSNLVSVNNSLALPRVDQQQRQNPPQPQLSPARNADPSLGPVASASSPILDKKRSSKMNTIQPAQVTGKSRNAANGSTAKDSQVVVNGELQEPTSSAEQRQKDEDAQIVGRRDAVNQVDPLAPAGDGTVAEGRQKKDLSKQGADGSGLAGRAERRPGQTPSPTGERVERIQERRRQIKDAAETASPKEGKQEPRESSSGSNGAEAPKPGQVLAVQDSPGEQSAGYLSEELRAMIDSENSRRQKEKSIIKIPGGPGHHLAGADSAEMRRDSGIVGAQSGDPSGRPRLHAPPTQITIPGMQKNAKSIDQMDLLLHLLAQTPKPPQKPADRYKRLQVVQSLDKRPMASNANYLKHLPDSQASNHNLGHLLEIKKEQVLPKDKLPNKAHLLTIQPHEKVKVKPGIPRVFQRDQSRNQLPSHGAKGKVALTAGEDPSRRIVVLPSPGSYDDDSLPPEDTASSNGNRVSQKVDQMIDHMMDKEGEERQVAGKPVQGRRNAAVRRAVVQAAEPNGFSNEVLNQYSLGAAGLKKWANGKMGQVQLAQTQLMDPVENEQEQGKEKRPVPAHNEQADADAAWPNAVVHSEQISISKNQDEPTVAGASQAAKVRRRRPVPAGPSAATTEAYNQDQPYDDHGYLEHKIGVETLSISPAPTPTDEDAAGRRLEAKSKQQKRRIEEELRKQEQLMRQYEAQAKQLGRQGPADHEKHRMETEPGPWAPTDQPAGGGSALQQYKSEQNQPVHQSPEAVRIRYRSRRASADSSTPHAALGQDPRQTRELDLEPLIELNPSAEYSAEFLDRIRDMEQTEDGRGGQEEALVHRQIPITLMSCGLASFYPQGEGTGQKARDTKRLKEAAYQHRRKQILASIDERRLSLNLVDKVENLRNFQKLSQTSLDRLKASMNPQLVEVVKNKLNHRIAERKAAQDENRYHQGAQKSPFEAYLGSLVQSPRGRGSGGAHQYRGAHEAQSAQHQDRGIPRPKAQKERWQKLNKVISRKERDRARFKEVFHSETGVYTLASALRPTDAQ